MVGLEGLITNLDGSFYERREKKSEEYIQYSLKLGLFLSLKNCTFNARYKMITKTLIFTIYLWKN